MITQLLTCAFRIAVFGLAVAAFAQTSTKPPIVKEGFLRAVEIGGLTEDELIFYVSDRGVDFKLTPEERTKSGLSPRLAGALEANYRPPVAAPKAPNGGGPISQDELLGWLRGGFDLDSIEVAVNQRGVGFALTPELSRGLEAAGVRPSLIGLLAARQKAEALKQHAAKPAPAPPPLVSLPTPATAVPSSALEDALYVIRRVKPVYPAGAKKGLSGVVRLKVSVNPEGRVENVELLEGLPVLAAAAEQAVRKWIYEPPLAKGKPSHAETVVRINFKAPSND